jgi:hypothetical protein
MVLLPERGIVDAKDNMVGSFILPHCVIATDNCKIQAAQDIIEVTTQIAAPGTQTDQTIVVAPSHAVLRLLVKPWEGKLPDFMGAGAPMPFVQVTKLP